MLYPLTLSLPLCASLLLMSACSPPSKQVQGGAQGRSPNVSDTFEKPPSQGAQGGAQGRSPNVSDTFQSAQSARGWGRTTALLYEPKEGRLWTGHEAGWLACWRIQRSARAITLTLKASWLAHEGALRDIQHDTDHQGALWSLGGDGSWASWSVEGRVISRGRAKGQQLNVARQLPKGGWLVGGERGVISRQRNGEREWRTAGEHGRAVFGLELMGEEALSVGADGWLRRWDSHSGQMIGARAAHQGWATQLTLATQGARPRFWLTGGSDGVVRAWPLNVARALVEAPPPKGAQGHERDLTRLVSAWPWVVSGGEDGRLALYQLSEVEPHLSVMQQRPLSRGPIMSLLLTQSPQEHTPLTLWVGGGAHPLDVHLFELQAGELRERTLTFISR